MKQIIYAESVDNISTPNFLCIYTTTRCQFNCYYCNSKNVVRTNPPKYLDANKLQKFVDIYDKVADDYLYIELTGGEPTYTNSILDVVNILAHSEKIKYISMVTNGQADVDTYKNIAKICKDNNKSNEIFFSYHFNSVNDPNTFSDKLNNMYEDDVNCILRIMIDPFNITEEIRSTVEYFVNNDKYHLLKELGYITGHGFCNDTYIDNIKKQLDDKVTGRYIRVTYDDGSTEILSTGYIQSLDYNPFKGMYCESMYKRHGLTSDCDLYPRCYSPNQTRLLPKFRKCFSESMVKDYIAFIKSNYVRCELNKCECRSGIVSKKWR